MTDTIRGAVTCPVTKSQCLLIPACDLREMTGASYCVEWVKLQQAQGRKKLETDTAQDHRGSGNGTSSEKHNPPNR